MQGKQITLYKTYAYTEIKVNEIAYKAVKDSTDIFGMATSNLSSTD